LWFNMQKTHIWNWVYDTMHDIILETSAAWVANIYIYLYLKLWKNNWVARLTRQFSKINKTETKKQLVI
jgi:hypothetical protein